jgi:hypothetical protein
MKKQDDTPTWGFLAFASVKTRRGGLMMVGLNALSCLYCIPWSHYAGNATWVAKVFIVHNWYWLPVMIAITAWYGLGFQWINRHDAWSDADSEKGDGALDEQSPVPDES